MTQYVQLSEDGTKVITWYGGPQPLTHTHDKPGYAEIADDDPRYLAFENRASAREQFDEAMHAGVRITSRSVPTLSGVYPIDHSSLLTIATEAAHVHATTARGTAKFLNGQSIKPLFDSDGHHHLFDTTQFVCLSEAVHLYVDHLHAALKAAETGMPWAAPVQPILIP